MKNRFNMLFLLFTFLPAIASAQNAIAVKQQAISFGPSLIANEKSIKLSTGIEMEYVEQGDPRGVPVILLHGFTDSWRSFAGVLPLLPSSMHVFALSQRGHGNSGKTATTYRPTDFADDIAAFIQQQKLGSAVIVGHSMGSTNAQCFATRYPEQTKALVLVASFASYDKVMITEFKKVIDELNDPIDSTFIAEFQASTTTRPITNDMMSGFINESRKVPAHVWKGVAAGWSEAGFLSQLRSLSIPALLIWGDKDPYCTREDQYLLKQAIKRSTLLVYEGTGHANHWEEPGRFAKDLTRFIKTLSKP